MKSEQKLEKLMKKLPVGWAEEAEGMSEKQLRDVIVDSENNLRNAKAELEANEKYQELKNALAEVRGPASDAVKAQKAKIEYALHLLEKSGKI